MTNNRPTQVAIENLYQDMEYLCAEIRTELGNAELEINDDNATEWFDMHHRLLAIHDDLASLRRKSGPMPREPDDRYVPIFL